jgi:formylglycine-generating enzyme required for sulfatase activity
VTVAQYGTRRGGPRGAPPSTDTGAPVTDVTRNEAKAYCAAVGGRLPTEAEWEYAARAGTNERYYDTPPSSIAWFADNSDEHVHAVAGKAPNAFGLHDMLGNVYEWVLDRYYDKYDDTSDAEIEEPVLPNSFAAARGGAWTSGGNDIRVSNRLAVFADDAEPIVGFRCASSEK